MRHNRVASTAGSGVRQATIRVSPSVDLHVEPSLWNSTLPRSSTSLLRITRLSHFQLSVRSPANKGFEVRRLLLNIEHTELNIDDRLRR